MDTAFWLDFFIGFFAGFGIIISFGGWYIKRKIDKFDKLMENIGE